MTTEIDRESQDVGLKMNVKKTTSMRNTFASPEDVTIGTTNRRLLEQCYSAGIPEKRRALSNDLQPAGLTHYVTTTMAKTERSDTGPRRPSTGSCGGLAGSHTVDAAEERDA